MTFSPGNIVRPTLQIRQKLLGWPDFIVVLQHIPSVDTRLPSLVQYLDPNGRVKQTKLFPGEWEVVFDGTGSKTQPSL